MNSALWLLMSRTFINRAKFMVSRMREPRYLVPAMLFFGYMLLVASGAFLPRSSSDPKSGDVAAIAPLAVEVFVFVMLCTVLVTAPSNPAPIFNESEAHLLLAGPVSRRTLVLFSLVRAQLPLLWVSAMLGLIGARGGNPLLVGVSTYLVLNLLTFARLASVMFAARLSSVRFGGWLARLPGVGLAVLGILNVALVYQPVEQFPRNVPDGVALANSILHAGPLAFVMQPFRLISGLGSTHDLFEFATSAGAILAMLAALGLFSWALDSHWEEAALARAQRLTNTLNAFRQGRAAFNVAPATEHARRTPFRLAPDGPLWRAFAWKSMVAIRRQNSSRALVLIMAIIFPVIGAAIGMSSGRAQSWIAPLALIGMLEMMLPMMAPALFPHDIRGEMDRIDLLKSFPVPGRDVMRGGVYACAAYVGFYQIVLLVVAVILVNGPGARPFPIADRVLVGLGLMPVLPLLTALSFSLEGAGAVMMPSWLTPSKAGVAAFETAGRNMLLAVIRMFGVVLCMIPVAGIVSLVVGVIVFGLNRPAVMCVPFAGVAAAGVMWLEVEFLARFAGARLATLDPSMEQV